MLTARGYIGLLCIFAIIFAVGCKKNEKEILESEIKQTEGSSINKELSDLKGKIAGAKDDFERSEIYGKISERETEKGDIASSIKSANESVKFYPGSAQSHYLLGKSYLAAGRFSEAENELKISLDIDSKFAPSHYEMGNLLYKLRRYPDAVKEYLLAVKYNPKDYQAYNNMGALYQQTGKLKEAESAYNKVKELNPGYAGVYKNLGILYEQGLKNREAAKAAYSEYLRLKPNASDRMAVKIWINNLGSTK